MSAQPKSLYTPEEYLRIERSLEQRHEYYRGEMFAMSGASRAHNLIGINVSASLHAQLADRPCEVYQNDMRVKAATAAMYFYPDVVATCENPRFEDDAFDTLLNPQVIVEVLSDSTASFDRGAKFEAYRQIASLREYVLVDQSRAHVERYLRDVEQNRWVLDEAHGLDAEIELPSLACRLKLSDVYAKVTWGL
jgi:Uma2 family endonuclease